MSPSLGESILRAHATSEYPAVGETVNVKVDLMLLDDYTMPRASEFFEKMQGKIPINKDNIMVTCEHFMPPYTFDEAKLQNETRTASRKWSLHHFYEVGRSGIGPLVAISNNLIKPELLVVGTSSIVTALGGLGCYSIVIGSADMAMLWRKGEIHLIVPKFIDINISGRKKSYIEGMDIALAVLKNMPEIDEYHSFDLIGESLKDLTLDERLELSYFITQKGANAAVIYPSPNLFSVLNIPLGRFDSERPHQNVESDFHIDISVLQPMVSISGDLDEISSISELESIAIDVVIVGGSVMGTIGNLRILDRIISGRKLNKNVRLYVYPASSDIFKQAVKEGIIERLTESGSLICPPGRGAEGYGHRGLISPGEKVITNGSLMYEELVAKEKSKVFLAGTHVCATSAVLGKIANPSEFM